MKIGTLILLILVALIFASMKYKEHMKKIFDDINAMKTKKDPDAGKKKEVPSWVWNTMFVAIGAAIFFWGMYSPSSETPTLVKVVSWSREHWLWVLLLCGVLATLVQINAATLGKATGVLHQILVGTVFMLFIGFPMWMWLTDSGSGVVQQTPIAESRPLSRALPQNAPDVPWAWHMDQSKWPRVQVPPYGDSVHVPSIFGGHIVWGGSGFKVHYIYSDGHECVLGDNTSVLCGDGNIVEGYAHNEGGTTIYASYAYARQDEK